MRIPPDVVLDAFADKAPAVCHGTVRPVGMRCDDVALVMLPVAERGRVQLQLMLDGHSLSVMSVYCDPSQVKALAVEMLRRVMVPDTPESLVDL